MRVPNTVTVVVVLAATFAGACDRPHSQERAASDKDHALPDVTQTVALTAAATAHRLDGVALVLSPETLLQIDADLNAIKISADFSGATAGRYKSTGSLSRQIIENAERQAGIDGTQKKLLESRLRQTWGDGAPFLDAEARAPLIAKLTAGSQAIVRIDFAELSSGTPQNVELAPLAGGSAVAVKKLWNAPTGNLAMPGASYFALIDTAPGLRPGDRARATAKDPKTVEGVEIPGAAIVIFAGQSWCYIETEPGKYERRAVALDHPTESGFLVKGGFKPGERVVVRGASMLLSREAGPGDDDDDDGAKPAPRAKPDITAPPAKDDDDDKPAAKPEPTADSKPQPAPSGGAEAREAPPARPAKPNKAAAVDDDDDKPVKGGARAGATNKPDIKGN